MRKARCELVKKKEGGVEIAIVRELRERRAYAESDVALFWLKKWSGVLWRGCNVCNIIIVKKPNYVENKYTVEHWRLYEPPLGKPYLLRRFKMEAEYLPDHEEELGTSPVFVWEKMKNYSVCDVLRELRASVDFDVNVLFERLSHVAPFAL